MRHFCRDHLGYLIKRKKFQIVTKKPIDLLEKQSPNCLVCGILFKNINSLENHLENSKRNDIYHTLFFENKIPYEDGSKENIH